MKPPKKLAMRQIERRLASLRAMQQDANVRYGWIRYMREALCMTQTVLAKAAKVNQATVQQIEKREVEGKVTLHSLRKIAGAMNCELVYAFIPKDDLSSYLKQRALSKAAEIVRSADVHMTLEDQKVTVDINDRIERIAEDLLAKGDIW